MDRLGAIITAAQSVVYNGATEDNPHHKLCTSELMADIDHLVPGYLYHRDYENQEYVLCRDPKEQYDDDEDLYGDDLVPVCLDALEAVNKKNLTGV